jgi:hypothetical protein
MKGPQNRGCMVSRFVFCILLFVGLAFANLNGQDKSHPAAALEVTQTIDAPHMQVALEQSARTAMPGKHVKLVAELRLPKEMHLYAPGADPYKPVKLLLDALPELKFKPAIYPKSKILELPAINERVPVFDGTFQIVQDVQVMKGAQLWGSLAKDGKILTISGTLDYQACDSIMCYIPNSIPVKWQLQVLPASAAHQK